MTTKNGTIWQIIAYDQKENIDEVAELNKNLGVVAVGWSDAGNLKGVNLEQEKARITKKLKQLKYKNWQTAVSRGLIPFKNKMKIGDLVVLHKKGQNTIACVGEVKGNYEFNDKNELGAPDGFGYPQQRKVKWFERPINFSKDLLPKKFTGLGTQGTIHQVHGGSVGELRQALEKIHPEHEKSTGEPVDEGTIKEYLTRFIGKPFDNFETGLRLIEKEHKTDVGLVDFLAKDNNGANVMIEVKTTADSSAVGQLLGYLGTGKNNRGIILANDFKANCKKAIEKSGCNIRCFSCKKSIRFNEEQ